MMDEAPSCLAAIPPEAGTHVETQRWIPACAEKRPSHWKEMLRGMTDRGESSRICGNDRDRRFPPVQRGT